MAAKDPAAASAAIVQIPAGVLAWSKTTPERQGPEGHARDLGGQYHAVGGA